MNEKTAFAEYIFSICIGFLVSSGKTPEEIAAQALRVSEIAVNAEKRGLTKQFMVAAEEFSRKATEGQGFQDPT